MAASRIANVSAVLRAGRGTASASDGSGEGAGAVCRALFEEVVEIGRDVGVAGGVGGGAGDAAGAREPLASLAAALAATAGERVLVVEADAGRGLEAELVLALVAWPEADAVVPVDREGVALPCGLYRRETCRARLEELAARGGTLGPDALEAALGVERVALAVLGLAEPAVVGVPAGAAEG